MNKYIEKSLQSSLSNSTKISHCDNEEPSKIMVDELKETTAVETLLADILFMLSEKEEASATSNKDIPSLNFHRNSEVEHNKEIDHITKTFYHPVHEKRERHRKLQGRPPKFPGKLHKLPGKSYRLPSKLHKLPVFSPDEPNSVLYAPLFVSSSTALNKTISSQCSQTSNFKGKLSVTTDMSTENAVVQYRHKNMQNKERSPADIAQFYNNNLEKRISQQFTGNDSASNDRELDNGSGKTKISNFCLEKISAYKDKTLQIYASLQKQGINKSSMKENSDLINPLVELEGLKKRCMISPKLRNQMSSHIENLREIVRREKELVSAREKLVNDFFLTCDKKFNPEMINLWEKITNLTSSSQQRSMVYNLKSTSVHENGIVKNRDQPKCPIVITDVVSLSKESHICNEAKDYLYGENLQSPKKEVESPGTSHCDDIQQWQPSSKFGKRVNQLNIQRSSVMQKNMSNLVPLSTSSYDEYVVNKTIKIEPLD